MNTMRPDVEFSIPFEENIPETTFDPDVMQRVVAKLGLAFCRMAVEAHGGEIGLISSEGAGSTFWFTMPPAAVGEPSPTVVTGSNAVGE